MLFYKVPLLQGSALEGPTFIGTHLTAHFYREHLTAHFYRDPLDSPLLQRATFTMFIIAGQARLDGVMCEHSEEEKMSYLKMLRKNGVYNIEMECTALTSLCLISKIKCADVCVTLLDRLNGDQVCLGVEEW